MRTIRLLVLWILAALTRPFAHAHPQRVRRVLYIKPDHLGDLLLATPVLAALRQAMPDAQITALVGPWSQMVLQRNPDVDRLLTCPFPSFERNQRQTTNRVAHLAAYIAPYLLLLRYALLLRAGRYDVALIGRDDHWWGAALAALAGVPWRVGYAVPECRPFLTHALAWDPREHVTQQGLALVAAIRDQGLGNKQTSRQADRELRNREQGSGGKRQRQLVVHPLSAIRYLPFSIFHRSSIVHCPSSIVSSHPTSGIQCQSYAARFDPTPADLAWAEDWLAQRGIGPDDRLVILHPGTAGPTKLWLPERWAAVGDALQALPRVYLVLTGGPGEEALVAEVAGQMCQPPLTLAGQTSLGQLAALLRRATLVLGVDSGPLHLAAAQGTPSVHVFGPSDWERFGPWGAPARHVVLRSGVWCSPCGVFSACPRGLAQPECMTQIDDAAVVQVARALLERRVQTEQADDSL